MTSLGRPRLPQPPGDGPCRRQFRQGRGHPRARRAGRDRPCPLFDDRRDRACATSSPCSRSSPRGGFAVAHNGNISNAMRLRGELNRRGSIFQSTCDTEVIIHLVATSSYRTLLDRFIDALKQVEGAYSLVCLTSEGMIACRDPLGIRPLVMGRLGEAYIFASETVALDMVGATYLRTVEPGELIEVSDMGVRSLRPFAPQKPQAVHLRAYLFLAAGQRDRRPFGLQCAQADRRRAGQGKPGRCRLYRAGARFGRARGDRLRPAERHSVRARHHPLALCRPHLHPAGRPGPPPRREIEAQCQFGADPRQEHRPRRRFDRARHHQPQDRPDDARGRRARGPYADRQPADAPLLLLRRRHARAGEIARRADERRRDEPLYPRRQPRLRLDRRPLPRDRRGAARRSASRSIATPASPATIRRSLTDQDELEKQATSSGSWKNASPDAGGVRGQAGAGHRRRAGHRRGDRRGAGRGGRARRPDRADRRGAGGGRGTDPRRRRIGDDRADGPHRAGRHRQAGAGRGGALAGARHARSSTRRCSAP